MNKLQVWWATPASWYQFWMPQSAWRGGLILGSMLGFVLGAVLL